MEIFDGIQGAVASRIDKSVIMRSAVFSVNKKIAGKYKLKCFNRIGVKDQNDQVFTVIPRKSWKGEQCVFGMATKGCLSQLDLSQSSK